MKIPCAFIFILYFFSFSINAINDPNNLDIDPLFVDIASRNFQILNGSPAVNKENNAADGLAGITIDLAGNARVFNTTVDMGTYEKEVNNGSSCEITSSGLEIGECVETEYSIQVKVIGTNVGGSYSLSGDIIGGPYLYGESYSFSHPADETAYFTITDITTNCQLLVTAEAPSYCGPPCDGEICESTDPCYFTYFDENCNCIQELTNDCACNPDSCDCNDEICCVGTTCDDNNPDTSNDVITDEDCNCMGTITSCTYSAPNNANFLIQFEVNASLSCEDGDNSYDGIINISLAQYVADDWYSDNFYECNGRGGVIIIRGNQFRGNSSGAIGRSNSSPCFSENWTVSSNEECGIASLSLKINVFDETSNTLSLNSSIASNTYLAKNTIVSRGTVSSTAQVKFIAGQSIILEPGFTVAANATFLTKIETLPSCSALNRIIPSPNTFQQSLAENVAQTDLQVFPNPFNTQTTLSYQLNQPESVFITLLGLNGQTLRTIQNSTFQEAGTYTLSIAKEQLPNGVYFISFRSSSKNVLKRIAVF